MPLRNNAAPKEPTLEEDLKKRIEFMDGEIQYIEANVKTRQSDYKQKLEEPNLLEDKDIEESRFVQEIAYMADKWTSPKKSFATTHNKL